MLKQIFVCGVFMAIMGCGSVSVETYKEKTPILVLEDFFSGPMMAYGTVSDRGGRVTRHFECSLVGRWENNQGVLDEVFKWSDGEVQTRQWTFKKIGPNRYEGTAADVVGVATAETAGNALNMKYVLKVPVKGSVYEVSVDDWIYKISDKIALNKATMSKWGFKVGELQLAFVK